jgi:hypothetical protein
MRIRSDSGGHLGVYIDRYTALRDSGGHLVVDGRCDSACTVFMGIIPVIASA